MPSATIPTTKVVQWMSSSVRSQLPSSRQLFVPVALVPVSLGSSPITTSIAAPKRNPVITGLDSSRDNHPIRRTAASRNSNPVAHGDRRDELRRRCAVGDARDRHRAGGDRRQRRAWPGGDLPRGAEGGIDQRARRRGVEAVLDRHLSDPGVPQGLGDDERRHGDAGDHVVAEVGTAVHREPACDRQEVEHGHTLARPPRLGVPQDHGAMASRRRRSGRRAGRDRPPAIGWFAEGRAGFILVVYGRRSKRGQVRT